MDFGPAVWQPASGSRGWGPEAGKGHVHEFHLDDFLLVRGHRGGGGGGSGSAAGCVHTRQCNMWCLTYVHPLVSLSGGELTIRMVQVFVALLCAANPLEKTKCELDGLLNVVLNHHLKPVLLPCPTGLLLLSGYRDHLSKGEFTIFVDILSQIFSGFQEVFPVDATEQLWALAVPHGNVRELVWHSLSQGS